MSIHGTARKVKYHTTHIKHGKNPESFRIKSLCADDYSKTKTMFCAYIHLSLTAKK